MSHYDVLVVGSGFGGSVTALRLTEKGYRVGVLEAGRRFDETSSRRRRGSVRRFLWAPRLGCYGIQRISLLKDVMILAGAGVGGGSLNYANTLYEPLPPFYADAQWGHITDWRAELAPFYDQAKRMLGVVREPDHHPVGRGDAQVAERDGRRATRSPTPVGVFFGAARRSRCDDPFFGGVGPARRGCIQCGECMTGCRHGAKNTLLKNYLYLAEQAGAEVHPLTTVTDVRPVADGGYAVDDGAHRGLAPATAAHVHRRPRRVRGRHARHAEAAAPHAGRGRAARPVSAPGRAHPHQLRGDPRGPDVPPGRRLHQGRGHHVVVPPRRRTPTSSRCATARAATSWACSPPPWPTAAGPRPLTWLREVARHPVMLLRNSGMRRWSEQTIIALVMQTRDNSITCVTERRRLGRSWLTSKQGHGEPNPTWIPAGHEAVRRIADRIDGFAGGGLGRRVQHPDDRPLPRRRGRSATRPRPA